MHSAIDPSTPQSALSPTTRGTANCVSTGWRTQGFLPQITFIRDQDVSGPDIYLEEDHFGRSFAVLGART